MFTVHIRWGSSEETQDANSSTYTFETEAELVAFTLGVDQASGWMDYEQIDEGDECPVCHNGTVEQRKTEDGYEFACRGECGAVL